jgi:hypothetical protein
MSRTAVVAGSLACNLLANSLMFRNFLQMQFQTLPFFELLPSSIVFCSIYHFEI